MPQLKPTRGLQLNRNCLLARGVVRHWLFNEGSGNKVFDSSGKGKGGTFRGTAPSWTSGKFGSAVLLPGTDEYIDCGDIDALNGVSQFTIVFSAKSNGHNDDMGTFSKYEDLTHRIVLAYQGADTDDFYIIVANGSNSYGITSGNVFPAGIENQGVVVFDGSGAADADKLKFYVNGIEKTLTYGGILPSVTDDNSAIFQIGNDPSVANRFFNGQIDYFLIYNRALSAYEIALLYLEPFCGFWWTIIVELEAAGRIRNSSGFMPIEGADRLRGLRRSALY